MGTGFAVTALKHRHGYVDSNSIAVAEEEDKAMKYRHGHGHSRRLRARSALAGVFEEGAPEVLPPAPVDSGTPTPTRLRRGPQSAASGHPGALRAGHERARHDLLRHRSATTSTAPTRPPLQTQAQYLAAVPEGARDYRRPRRRTRHARIQPRAGWSAAPTAAKNYLRQPRRCRRTASARSATARNGPEALGSNEQAWAQNRRAVTVLIN